MRNKRSAESTDYLYYVLKIHNDLDEMEMGTVSSY